MTRALLLTSCVALAALLLACGGAGSEGADPKDDEEMAARGKRMHQPNLPKGTDVRLFAHEAAAKGLVRVSLGSKPGEAMTDVPNKTTATVEDDPTFGGFYEVKITFTSGEHAGKTGWASRGDMERLDGHGVTSP